MHRIPSIPSILSRARVGIRAFTLIEMILVISIISVLLGLLYGALERAQKFSRRTIAYSELKTIETAFKQYHTHYHTWPTNELADVAFSSPGPAGTADQGFIIDERIAALLQGSRSTASSGPIDADAANRFNPDMIPFLELSRYSPATHAPVNPFKPKNSSNPGTTRAYKVLFDTNGDHQLQIPAGFDTDAPTSPATNIIADVAVWTVIPATRRVDDNGNPLPGNGDVIFGSWQPFNVQ
jgi:prepilin-type N-terminal cleavage/methylation domain-containing protein